MQNSVGIIGGGLAGLTLAIQLAEQGREVTLFEKKFILFIGFVANTLLLNLGSFWKDLA